MSGLLKRSTAYRKRLLVEDNVKPSDLLQSDDSGISAEERREILQEIDRMTSDQRAGLSPDALVVSRAARRGFVFPLLVNVAMLAIAAGGLFGLYTFFEAREQQRVEQGRQEVSAQAELIRRIQEQAQAELEQKEQEIASIQQRLGDIEARRAALETNLEEELARREAELRAELEAELAAERARLEEQGTAEPQIADRLAELESEGNAEIEAELDAIRAAAEAERAELDESLAQLESEFQGQLSQLRRERAEIVQQAEAREAELRGEFEQELATSEEELSAARAELEALSERRERERQAANQIVGYYDEIRTQIRTDEYGAALSTIEQLRQYLAEDSVASLPAVQQRRESELFILSSLEQLVEDQQETRATDTDALIARARVVQEATRLVNEGNAALEEGNTAEAEALYSEALELIPAVSEGHQYFAERQAGRIAELEARRNDRTAAAEEAVQAGDAAFAAADYGAALASYREAVSYLPQDVAAAEEIISRIRASSVTIADRQAVNQQSAAAAPVFEAAQSALSDGDYETALEGFVTVAADFPRSRQMDGIPAAISETMARRTTLLEGRIDTLSTEIERLEASNADLAEQAAEQETAATERDEQLIALRSRNAELQTRVSELRTELTETTDRLETARAEAAAAGEEPDATAVMTEQVREELEQLRTVEEDYEALRASYLAYADREDRILDSGTDAARLETKLLLDSFLASRPVRETLPGLRDRIKAYDRAFEDVGRETALLDTVDIVYELSTFEETDAKLSYLDERRRATDDPNMVAFLDELEVLIRQAD